MGPGVGPRLATMSPSRAVVTLVACAAVHSSTAFSTAPHMRALRPGAAAIPSDTSKPSGMKAVSRLRGGNSMLQSISSSYVGIPILTRTWFSVILAFAGLTQVSLLPPEAVQLDATATVHRLQLWRPLTAMSFFGGIGPPLLQKMYYLIQFGTALESTLGKAEYARVLASCAAMLSIIFHALGWRGARFEPVGTPSHPHSMHAPGQSIASTRSSTTPSDPALGWIPL